MRQAFRLLAVTLALLTSVNGVMAGTNTDERLKKQREMFPKAEYAARKPRAWEYKHLYNELRDYPLAPYLELKALKRYPYLSNRKKIDRFLTKYRGTPLDWPLRKKWLDYLAKKDQQALYLHYYRPTQSVKYQCTALLYQLNRGDDSELIYRQVDKLWVVGKSQNKACDPLFKRWKQAGFRTHDKIWKRLSLAADGGNHTLIPYLKSLLPKNEHYLADLWYKVRRDPSYVGRLSRFPGKIKDKEAQIIAYGLKRLIWRDRNLALKTWAKAENTIRFTQAQKDYLAQRFAISLSAGNHSQAETWLKKVPKRVFNESIYQWQLAHELRGKEWQDTLAFLETVPDDFRESSHKYWQARSLEKLGSDQKANSYFNDLAQQRHYYGFMASGKLDKFPSFAHQPVKFTELELAKIKNMPAVKRAYEFLQLKRYSEARREWNYVRRGLSKSELKMAAVIADSWDWHEQVIFTFAQAGYLHDVDRRFPLAFTNQLISNAKKNNIDPAWAFAIVRRESSFMVDANSKVGAKGLMQVMPSTAKYLTKRKISTRQLLKPETNIKLGTEYLQYLLKKHEGNPVLATAAYNAGSRRVFNWQPDQATPADIWIETIPYKETRDYVKNVMAYKQIYKTLLGENDNLFKDISTMTIEAD